MAPRQNGLSGLGDRWGAETSPDGFDLVYAQEAEKIAPGIVDYAQTIRSVGMSLVDAIAQARNTLAMSDAQRQMLDIQIQRAQAGQPPINSTQYFGGGSPLNQAISSQTLLWVLGGGLLVWALTRGR